MVQQHFQPLLDPNPPHLNYASSSLDTSSSTAPEILAIAHALQTATNLKIKNLVIFSDSTPAATLAGTAVLSGIHQSQELTSLSRENHLLKTVFNNIHQSAKKLELLALIHVNAHQLITDHVTATNAICDALAKEEAKSALLLKLPPTVTKPKMSEVFLNLPSTSQSLSY